MSDSPEKQVLDIGLWSHFDMRAYSFVCELKKLLEPLKDLGTSMDSGTDQLIADMLVSVGGVEYLILVRPSNGQLIKEGKATPRIV